MNITTKIDSRNLNAGLAAASKYTKRSLPQMLNTSGFYIAVNALHNTPFVTAERIDAELGTIVTPKIGKRGKPLSTRSARNRIYSSGRTGDSAQAPLAALIVVARANPNSFYNRSTHQRFLLDKNPFKGVSREAGRAAMAALVHKLISTRHRSGSFIRSGFVPAIRTLQPFAQRKFMKGGANPSEGLRQYYGPDLGEGIPADEFGSLKAMCTVRNYVGTEGANAPSANRALDMYAGPAFQAAVDQEGESNANYALRKMAEELRETTDKHWK